MKTDTNTKPPEAPDSERVGDFSATSCSRCEQFRQKAIEETERSGDLLSENRKLRKELENIAKASPQKWEMPPDEFATEFRWWAQNRAGHVISDANATEQE